MILAHARTEQQTATESARHYLQRGYAVVPVPTGRKGPNLPGWQRTTYDAGGFSDRDNIGLKTGQPSNGLVDVDLDCAEALALADEWLPPTDMEHGRPERERSHRWYVVADRLPKTSAYDDVDGRTDGQDGHKARLVELRSTGAQTLVPPSLHTTGTRYAWNSFGTPASVDAGTLETAVRQLAATALLARHWPDEGKRHDTALAVAGLLLRGGVDMDIVARMVESAASYAEDEEIADRVAAVRTTADRLARGENVKGGPQLADLLGSAVVAKLSDWLALPSHAARPRSGATGGTLLPDAEFTDTGNAERLARDYGHKLRYVPRWGWLAYRDGVWQRGGEGDAMQCAKACANDLLRDAVETADMNRKRELAEHAKRTLSERGLSAMLKLARSEPGIAATEDEFDADPWLLNVQNGTIDLRTGARRAHDPADMLTRQAPVTYDPDATAPRWEQFLSEVFRGDEDLTAFVQRSLGYSLTGVTREQVFFLCYGTGCNGKSTLLDAVTRVLGADVYAQPLKARALMRHEFDGGSGPDPEIAKLVGARFVTAQEQTSGRLNTDLVKELTGGDAMQVREPHKMPFTFRPQFKLWLSTNERPTVDESTNAIWRRIRYVPFVENFESRRDVTLPDALAAEAPGILAWLVRGALAWQQEGLGTAVAVQDATRQYREDEDPYLDFFEGVLVRADRGSRVLGKDAYAAFTAWQGRADGVPYLTDREFYKRAEARGYAKTRSNGTRWLVGCRLEHEG